MNQRILIVGGGLAGTILAWQFHLNNIDFLLVNKERANTSSKVAAGIYNPIVFKRFTASWMAELLIPTLDEFYSKIEEILNDKFHFKIDIYKILSNQDEINLWKKKSQDFPNKMYMDENIIENKYENIIENNVGFGRVKNSGFVDTNKFLELSHKFFAEIHKIKTYELFYKDIKKDILVENEMFSKIVFAEGYYGENNPFFPNLRYNFAKGEVLEIEIENFEIDHIISKNLFLFPISKNRFKVGASFQWTFADEEPTEFEKNRLLENLEKFLITDYKVVGHKAGIRPATFDRRPFLGQSKIQNNVYIFNGMGSKAVLLAPYCASILQDLILENKEIPFEISIERIKK